MRRYYILLMLCGLASALWWVFSESLPAGDDPWAVAWGIILTLVGAD